MPSEQGKLSFTQDSPLFAKSLAEFNENAGEMAGFLKSLAANMKQYCKLLTDTAKCGEYLFHKVKDYQSLIHIDNGLSPTLQLLENVMSEIAGSQEILSQSLEKSFVDPLELYCASNIGKFTFSHLQYIKEKASYDDSIVRYLQCENSGFGKINQVQMNTRALDVVEQLTTFELTRFDLVNQGNDMLSHQSFELAECCVASMVALRSHHHACCDQLDSLVTVLNDSSSRQQRERDEHVDSAAPTLRNRKDIASVLEAMRERVETQMPEASSLLTDVSSAMNTLSPESLFLPANPHDDSIAQAAQAFTRIGAAIGANIKTSFMMPMSPGQSFSVSDGASDYGGNNTSSLANMEMAVKALDRQQLECLYTQESEADTGNIVKQGFVLEKASGGMLAKASWSRQWLVLDDSKLYFMRQSDVINGPLELQVVCDTLLAAVRERPTEGPFCFEIVHANSRAFTLQAEGPLEYAAWTDAIRGAIERRLISQCPATPNIGSKKIFSNPGTDEENSGASDSAGSVMAVAGPVADAAGDIIGDILRLNSSCCECGKANPEWLSLNLGSLVCIDCSGVHRSLGVHISKVRSLTLDGLERAEYELLARMGNAMNLRIWEARINDTIPKPRIGDTYSARDIFIRAKYQHRKFLTADICGVNPANSISAANLEILETIGNEDDKAAFAECCGLTAAGAELARMMLSACITDDVETIMTLLAHGVSTAGWPEIDVGLPCSASISLDDQLLLAADDDNDDCDGSEKGRESSLLPLHLSKSGVPLHVAAAHGALSVVVLLLLNGADMYAASSVENECGDDDSFPQSTGSGGGSVLPMVVEIANLSGQQQVSQYLTRKLELLGPRCTSCKTTVSVSRSDSISSMTETLLISPGSRTLSDYSTRPKSNSICSPDGALSPPIKSLFQGGGAARPSSGTRRSGNSNMLEKMRMQQDRVDKLRAGLARVFSSVTSGGGSGATNQTSSSDSC